jgi:hypothetical protein
LEAQFFKTPMPIVAIPECSDCRAHFLEILEDAPMDSLFLQGPVEPFGHAVGLRLGDKGEAGRDAPEPDLMEEVVRSVLRAVAGVDSKA